MDGERLLKCDLFGEVLLRQGAAGPEIVRNAAAARWWLRWLARRLLRREAEALAALEGLDGVPQLLQGVILFVVVGGDMMLRYRIRLVR